MQGSVAFHTVKGSRRRSRLLTVALAGVICASGVAYISHDASASGATGNATGTPPIPESAIPARPGPFGSGYTLLPSGRILTPAGTQTVLDSVPTNAVLSPDGRYLLVTDNGRGAYQQVQVVSTKTLKVIQVVGYQRPNGLFLGLAYADHGTMAYASGGGESVVHAYSVARNGQLTARTDISLAGPGNWNPFPAGMTALDGGKLLAVAENGSDRIGIVNPATGHVISEVAVGIDPYTVVKGPGTTIYASIWGSERVAAINVPAACATAKTCKATTIRTIRTGAHPCAMAIGGGYLYVADANSAEITVISIATNRAVGTIFVGMKVNGPLGSSPESLALSPDHTILYVANSGENAIAVVHLDGGTTGTITGRIPTGDYPSTVILDPASRRLYVTDMLATGPGPNVTAPSPSNGLLSTIPVPDDATLATMTAVVAEDDNPSRFSTGRPTGNPVPLRGGTSPIKHVIYIVKENQSYDQVFGDLPNADGDSGLTRWGKAITPNLHALALRFGVFDNFYDDGAASADGHNWAFSANDDDFNQKLWWQRYSARAEFRLDPGADPMDLSPGGYIWDDANHANIYYRDYGEFYPRPNRDRWFMSASDAGTCKGPVATTYLGIAIPPGDVLCLPPSTAQPTSYNLTDHHDPRSRGLDMRYSDIDREAEWQREFNQFVKHGNLPRLEVMWLPNDHTASGSGYLMPASYLAQNDRAVGLLVDAVSHSKYWKSTAIFITQDDAEGSHDHVNSRRTECLVISPYSQNSSELVHSGLFDNASMLRTMELILGLKPMSEFDSTAVPMWQAFNTRRDMTPFDALPLAVPPVIRTS